MRGSNGYDTRDDIMKLLSDEEIVRMSDTEAHVLLQDGDEYVDLAQLDRGAQRASTATTAPMQRVMAKKVLSARTWKRIVTKLSK